MAFCCGTDDGGSIEFEERVYVIEIANRVIQVVDLDLDLDLDLDFGFWLG